MLHDWNDQQARGILLLAAKALAPGGRIVLIEFVLEEDRPDGGLLDLNMLVMCGSRERQLGEWHSLANGAGLEVEVANPLPTYGSLIVLRSQGE